MTQFALKVDEDIVNFLNIQVDKNGIAINDNEAELVSILNEGPSVVDISHLEYIPYLDSEWDGIDFIDSENREIINIESSKIQDKRFAFLVNNKYKFFYGVVDSEPNAMIIAALSSSPQIVTVG